MAKEMTIYGSVSGWCGLKNLCFYRKGTLKLSKIKGSRAYGHYEDKFRWGQFALIGLLIYSQTEAFSKHMAMLKGKVNELIPPDSEFAKRLADLQLPAVPAQS